MRLEEVRRRSRLSEGNCQPDQTCGGYALVGVRRKREVEQLEVTRLE